MEIYVNRLLRERGTIMGTLKVVKEVAGEGIELVKVCGTVSVRQIVFRQVSIVCALASASVSTARCRIWFRWMMLPPSRLR